MRRIRWGAKRWLTWLSGHDTCTQSQYWIQRQIDKGRGPDEILDRAPEDFLATLISKMRYHLFAGNDEFNREHRAWYETRDKLLSRSALGYDSKEYQEWQRMIFTAGSYGTPEYNAAYEAWDKLHNKLSRQMNRKVRQHDREFIRKWIVA